MAEGAPAPLADPLPAVVHAPDPPKSGRIRKRVAMYEDHIRRPTFVDRSGVLEDRDAAPQGRRATVGESGAAKKDRRGRYFVFFPIVRMNVSIGMAESVSIWTVPRAPRPTDTREIVSLSFASTMFTKS